MQPAEETSAGAPDGTPRHSGRELLEVIDLQSHLPAVTSRSLSLGRYVAYLAVADVLVAGLSAFMAISLRFEGGSGSLNGVSYTMLVPIFLVGWVVVMGLAGTYDKRILVSGPEEFRRVLNGAVWMLASIAVIGFAAHVAVSRSVIAVALAAAALLSLGARGAVRRVIHDRLRRRATLHRAVVVGSSEDAECLTSHMRRNPQSGFTVTGVHTPPRTARTMGERVAEILAIVGQTGADTVAVAGTSGFNASQLRRLAWGLEGTGVRLLMVPALTDLAGPRIRVRPISGLPLLHIEQPEFSGPKLVAKRGMDLVGGAAIVILLAPVLAVIALAVWVGSGRPILYSQVRVGRHGEEFKMFKFRTMVAHADRVEEAEADDAGATSPVRPKAEQDPRITRVGVFLRHHSLDELPQLINVFTGSMSLVGPRPHRPFEVADYGVDDRRRLLIKPGVTGLWQVSGRAALPWTEAVRLDLHYVENWSIWLDALLILKTLRAVLFPQGAY